MDRRNSSSEERDFAGTKIYNGWTDKMTGEGGGKSGYARGRNASILSFRVIHEFDSTGIIKRERGEGKRIIFVGEGISRGILVEKSKTFLLPPLLLLPSFFHRYFPQLHPPKRSGREHVGGRSTSREIVLTIAVSKQTGIATRGN